MSIDQDLEKIALQEKRLRFQHFDSEVAWVLGTALKAAAEKMQAVVAIDIQLLFFPTPCREPRRTIWNGFGESGTL